MELVDDLLYFFKVFSDILYALLFVGGLSEILALIDGLYTLDYLTLDHIPECHLIVWNHTFQVLCGFFVLAFEQFQNILACEPFKYFDQLLFSKDQPNVDQIAGKAVF